MIDLNLLNLWTATGFLCLYVLVEGVRWNRKRRQPPTPAQQFAADLQAQQFAADLQERIEQTKVEIAHARDRWERDQAMVEVNANRERDLFTGSAKAAPYVGFCEGCGGPLKAGLAACEYCNRALECSLSEWTARQWSGVGKRLPVPPQGHPEVLTRW